jgi:uncharacterized metal-binding protein
MKNTPPLPIVYSCSGASSAAQMANHLALRLDRAGAAEMSCIAGVGGDVPPLVRVAKSGRPIIALDGCALRCVLHILKRHDVVPKTYIMLRELGVKKQQHQDFSQEEADRVYSEIIARPDLSHPAPVDFHQGAGGPPPVNSAA